MTRNCLVVDDSGVVRKVSRRILEGLGFVVSEAENGLEALAACRKSMPELIMLDWHMPEMDGLEFLKALRADPGGDAPIVVFCTTKTEMQNIQEAIMSGANEYVMKPFDENIIKDKLMQVGLL